MTKKISTRILATQTWDGKKGTCNYCEINNGNLIDIELYRENLVEAYGKESCSEIIEEDGSLHFDYFVEDKDGVIEKMMSQYDFLNPPPKKLLKCKCGEEEINSSDNARGGWYVMCSECDRQIMLDEGTQEEAEDMWESWNFPAIKCSGDDATVEELLGASFKVEECGMCGWFIRCPRCGNNSCNGGAGEDGKCPVCVYTYKIQYALDCKVEDLSKLVNGDPSEKEEDDGTTKK